MTTNNFLQEFDKWSFYLRGFAMKLTRDKTQADDLFQETALNAFRYKDKFSIDTNMKAWLCTIMKNSFINQFRKKQRRPLIHDTTEELNLLNTKDTVVYNEGESNIQMKELLSTIDSLNDELRIPFLMAYQGYKYDEISERLGGLPMGTVKSRIFHARKMIKRKLKAIQEEEVFA